MKNILYFNAVIYFIIVGLYIFEFMIGALGQILLGLIQLIIAIGLSIDIKRKNNLGYKSLKIYWFAVLAWILLVIFNSTLNLNSETTILVLPMIIGFYFLIVNYLIYKNSAL